MAEYWSSSLFFFLLFYGSREENFRHPLGVRRNVIVGTKRAIPSGQYRSILAARVGNHGAEFGSSCPLAKLGIKECQLL